MITNRLNLPKPFVDAATSSHSYKPNRYSVTEVLGGTCEAVLKRRHAGDGEEDVADRVWAILGTAVHKVLESAHSGPQQHQEQWLCVPIDVDGKTYELSGIFDLYDEDTGTVTDWKVTSTWQVTFGDFDKWRMQTLAYCWMLRQNGHDAHRGQVVAILRDHSQRKARTERDYPPHPVHVSEWEFTEEDFEEMGRAVGEWMLEASRQERLSDGELEPCSPEKRWNKQDKWAVMRDGRKRAVRLFEDEGKAMRYLKAYQTQEPKSHIEFRKGEDTRCQSYCSVAKFCPYGREILKDS